jgi:hypothetical protein
MLEDAVESDDTTVGGGKDPKTGASVLSVFLYMHSLFEAVHLVHDLPACLSHRTFKMAQELLATIFSAKFYTASGGMRTMKISAAFL